MHSDHDLDRRGGKDRKDKALQRDPLLLSEDRTHVPNPFAAN